MSVTSKVTCDHKGGEKGKGKSAIRDKLIYLDSGGNEWLEEECSSCGRLWRSRI